ncbi:MAG: prepilin peptidase [bacterium]
MLSFLIIFAGLFGLVIGSFLNALIWRLHSGESMMDRSRCPKCHQVIAWYDNLPVVSYLLLNAKCRHCKKNIHWQYPVVEMTTAILYILSIMAFRDMLSSLNLDLLFNVLRVWFVIAVMIIVFVYDLRWYIILDKVIFVAAIVLSIFWLIDNLLLRSNFNIYSFLPLLLAVISGFGFFWLQYVISKGKWIGGGDVKLGIVIGLALPLAGHTIAAIFLAYMLGAIFGIGLIVFGKKSLGSKLPFGTFLAVSVVVISLWGDRIIGWYLKILGF